MHTTLCIIPLDWTATQMMVINDEGIPEESGTAYTTLTHEKGHKLDCNDYKDLIEAEYTHQGEKKQCDLTFAQADYAYVSVSCLQWPEK